MPKNGMKIVAGVGAAGAIAVSGAALASSQTPTPSPSSSSSSSTQSAPQGDHGMRGMGQDKTVSSATATSVKSAVKAKDSSITVNDVRQDPDGSYDALGTKSGNRVMVEVSKDLKTITVRTGGMGHGPGGHGDHKHGTPVSAATLTQIKAAVKAKDSAVTVQAAHAEQDGSYDAFGTKAGQPVHVEISKDMKTVTVSTGMQGHGPRGGFGGQGQQGQPSSSGTSTNSSSATAAA